MQLFVADRAIPESSQLSSPARCAALNRTGASIEVEPAAPPGGCRGPPPDAPGARRPITTLDNSAAAGLATGAASAGVCAVGGGVEVSTPASCVVVGAAADAVASAATGVSSTGAVAGASDASGAGSVIGFTGGAGIGGAGTGGADSTGAGAAIGVTGTASTGAGAAIGVTGVASTGAGSGIVFTGVGSASTVSVDSTGVGSDVDPVGGVASGVDPVEVVPSGAASLEDPPGVVDTGAGSGVNPAVVPDSGAASAALALAAPANVPTRAKITIPAHTGPLATILVDGLWVIRSTLPRCLRFPWRPMIDPGSRPCSRRNEPLDTLLAPSRPAYCCRHA